MGTTSSLSFNLGLPAVPETENKAIFLELAKLYNAVNIIAQTLDTYTSSGGATAAITVVLTDLQVQLDSIANITALVYQMDQAWLPPMRRDRSITSTVASLKPKSLPPGLVSAKRW